MLMGRYCIKKKDAYYQIAEIEFYYYGPNHPDIITYPRTCSEKQWFFHQSGVDLTIESNQKGESIKFGGILIRSLKKYDGNWNYIKTICGPQKCVNELFDVLDAFDFNNNLTPLLIETTKFGEIEVCSSQRYITFNVSKNELESKYNVLEKEKEILNNHYTNLLSEFNSKILKEQQEKEKKKEIDKKNNENLTEEQKKLISIKNH